MVAVNPETVNAVDEYAGDPHEFDEFACIVIVALDVKLCLCIHTYVTAFADPKLNTIFSDVHPIVFQNLQSRESFNAVAASYPVASLDGVIVDVIT
jgi:hypothetical protein